MSTAFESIRIGRWDLPQRFVMAPLTRNRAGEGQAPTELNAEYYGQRASAGLIITEGTQPSAVGQGYLDTPGIHSDEQVAGWRLVADAVHARGGTIVAQLMHGGRIGHPSIAGLHPVAPSAVRAAGELFTPEGMQDFVEPRALEIAGRLARGSQSAIRHTKLALNNWLRAAGPAFDASLALEFLDMTGPDVAEGVAAVREKRPPAFEGR